MKRARHRCFNCGKISGHWKRIVCAMPNSPTSEYVYVCANAKACDERWAGGKFTTYGIENPPKRSKRK